MDKFVWKVVNGLFLKNPLFYTNTNYETEK